MVTSPGAATQSWYQPSHQEDAGKKPAVTNLIGPRECDRHTFRPINFQVLPALSKCFLFTRWMHETNPKDSGNVPSGQFTHWSRSSQYSSLPFLPLFSSVPRLMYAFIWLHYALMYLSNEALSAHSCVLLSHTNTPQHVHCLSGCARVRILFPVVLQLQQRRPCLRFIPTWIMVLHLIVSFFF